MGAVPVQVPFVVCSVWPSRAVPESAGRTGGRPSLDALAFRRELARRRRLVVPARPVFDVARRRRAAVLSTDLTDNK